MINQAYSIPLKISTAILALSFFIGGHLLDYSLALFLLTAIFYSAKQKNFSFSPNKSLLLLIAFYVLHVIAVFYSDDKHRASFDLEVKASLIIFPLFFLFASKTAKDLKVILFKFFVIFSSVVSLTLIIRAFVLYLKTNDSSQLFYGHFSYFLHPSYYAMYLIFSIVLSFYLFSNNLCKIKFIPVLSALINLIALIMTDSKGGYVSFLIVVSYLLVRYLYNKSKIITISSIILLIILSVITIKQNKRLSIMFDVVSNYKETINHPETYKESTGLRILSWNAASEAIKENIVFGVGTGDIKPELFKKYKKLNYTHNLKREMNVHNQFLETWLGQGLIGFILLLIVFIIPFISAVKQKDIVLQAFLILVFVNFLFESMLNIQAGTVFFGFFYSLLVIPLFATPNRFLTVC